MISFSPTIISIISVSSGMFRKLRSIVPGLWVLVENVTFSDTCIQASQLWNSELHYVCTPVTSDSLSADQFILFTSVLLLDSPLM